MLLYGAGMNRALLPPLEQYYNRTLNPAPGATETIENSHLLAQPN